MKKKRKLLYLGVFLFLFLAFFTTAAFARGIRFFALGGTNIINDETGTAAVALNSPIQFITNTAPPDPSRTGFVRAGDYYIFPTQANSKIGGSNIAGSEPNVAGTLNFQFDDYYSSDTVYVRVWKGSIARGNYYGICPASQALSNSEGFGFAKESYLSFSTNLIADQPPPPSVSPGVVYIDVSGTLKPRADISLSASDARYELADNGSGTYGVQIQKGAGDQPWNESDPATITLGGGASLSTNPAVHNIDWDSTYRIRACARNYFVDASHPDRWTPAPPYQTFRTVSVGAMGGGGGVYNLGIKLISNPIDSYATEIELSWLATTGISNFKIWASATGLPGSFTELTPGTTYPGPTQRLTTDAGLPEAYFTVTPDTVTSLTDQPRQIVGKYTYKLRRPSGLTGINSIAMPFTKNWSKPAGGPVADPNTELTNAAAIRTTMANFEFAGGWNEVTQRDIGYLSTGGGTNFDLKSGIGYQVSVSAENTYYTVVGIK